MRIIRTQVLFYIFFFLLFSSFSLASITWYGEDISLIVDTFYPDTNVTTECGDGEFLLGNGSCVSHVSYLPGSAYSDDWINNTFATASDMELNWTQIDDDNLTLTGMKLLPSYK